MSATRPLLSDEEKDDCEFEFELEVTSVKHRTESAQKYNWYKGVGIMAGVSVVAGLLAFLLTKGLLVDSAGPPDYSKEKDPTHWRKVADDELKRALRKPTLGRAKNVILFIGDGMGPTTVTAGRILAGQKKGWKGEGYRLSFDKFPHTGMAVTYNVDTQVTDSAASATAYTSGVKTNQGVLGVNAKVTKGVCSTSVNQNKVDTLLRWFLNDGRSAGVVTTTTVTHATPGANYAHTPHRDWEVDTNMPQEAKDAGCEDIAMQLVKNNPDINVILGGGMNNFKPLNYSQPRPDPSPWYVNATKGRTDLKDLTQEWQDDKAKRNLKHKFVSNAKELNAIDTDKTDYLFGLFAEFHMAYEVERDPKHEPSLAEMTEKAIKVLQHNDKGFYLLVEGGRIDHGHHAAQPSKALHDVIAFSDAVEKAASLTDESDTLILVTADHSHTMVIAGYSSRGNDILGKSDGDMGYVSDKKPYTTLLYGDGPGYSSPRQNLSLVNTDENDYTSQSAVPMIIETHGGEDVAMYARGPQSFLYAGVHENNYIPILMAYASCVGPYSDEKDCAPEEPNTSSIRQLPHIAVSTAAFLLAHFMKH